MMPPSQNNSPSSRASSPPRSDLDSADPGSNAWVDVQPPETSPGLCGQHRTSISSIWSVISQATRRAQPTGAEAENMWHDTAYRPDIMSLARPLTEPDTENLRGPDKPAMSAVQNSPDARSQSNMTESPRSTHHGPPHDGANNINTQGLQQPAWSWKTVLIVEDEGEMLGLDRNICMSITLLEEDIASFAALKAKVFATLDRSARHIWDHDLVDWPSSNWDVSIGWSFCGLHDCPGVDDGYGGGPETVGNWSLTHTTFLSPLDVRRPDGSDGEGDGDKEESASWLRENMEIAASGLGKAVLVVKVENSEFSRRRLFSEEYEDEEGRGQEMDEMYNTGMSPLLEY